MTAAVPQAEGPTAPSLVLRALHRWPDRVAFSWPGGSLRYGALLAMLGRFQAVLARRDDAAPLRLALLSANRAEAWCAEVAVQALGGAISWLHPMGALADQLEQLADAGVDTLIVDAVAFRDRGGELAARAQGLKTVWTLGPAGYGVDLLAAAEAAGEASARDLSSPEQMATLNYTGGTTGKSKAAVRRQRGHAAMCRAILCDFELPASPRYLAAAPISHVAGTKILPTLLRGGSIHLLPRFDPAQVLATIQAERISMSLLVPTMIYALLDEPALARTDLSSLELLLYGASPMSPSRLLEGIERIGPVFSQLYGQTECYPISVLGRADHDPARPERFASCGQPIASTDVRLVGADGQTVAPGEPGEVWVRAPHAMEAYWQRDALTAETIVDGWLQTGDIARADPEGYLYIVDRKKDMVVSGGFNVYPREIEDVLTSDPRVATAAVIGVPDPKWGEAVLAVVVARPGATIDADALVRLVKEKKGAQCAPKRIEIVDALPLTAVGKVDKKALRAPYWAGLGRSVA